MTAFSHLVKYLFCVIQESCARVLLFRGANKEIKNYNSQTAFQVRLTLNKKYRWTFDASEVNVTFDAACIWSQTCRPRRWPSLQEILTWLKS